MALENQSQDSCVERIRIGKTGHRGTNLCSPPDGRRQSGRPGTAELLVARSMTQVAAKSSHPGSPADCLLGPGRAGWHAPDRGA